MANRYSRNPVVEESPLQKDLMLFDPVKSQFFVLNPTMAFLWRNCDGEKRLESVIETIPREFADSGERDVVSEFKVALDELISFGLVTPV